MEWVYDPPKKQNADAYFEEFSVALGSHDFDQSTPAPFGEFTMSFDNPYSSSVNNENNKKAEKESPKESILVGLDAELIENNSESSDSIVETDIPIPPIHEKPLFERLKKKKSMLFLTSDDWAVMDIDEEQNEFENQDLKNQYPLKKLDDLHIRPTSSPEHPRTKAQLPSRPQTVVNPSQRPHRTAWN